MGLRQADAADAERRDADEDGVAFARRGFAGGLFVEVDRRAVEDAEGRQRGDAGGRGPSGRFEEPHHESLAVLGLLDAGDGDVGPLDLEDGGGQRQRAGMDLRADRDERVAEGVGRRDGGGNIAGASERRDAVSLPLARTMVLPRA